MTYLMGASYELLRNRILVVYDRLNFVFENSSQELLTVARTDDGE